MKNPEESVFRVLVVDDNEADRRLATAMLVDAWPFEHDLVVDCAADGPEALEKLRSDPFALIILDWKLPTLNGGDILRFIRRDGRRLPVVVLSGLEREDIHEDLHALGAVFLEKDRMNAESFNAAIAASLRLMGMLEAPQKCVGDQ